MKVNSRLLRSRRRACQWKEKLDLENAQAYLLAAQKDTHHYKNPEDLELYLCVCGYLHVGHRIGSKKFVTKKVKPGSKLVLCPNILDVRQKKNEKNVTGKMPNVTEPAPRDKQPATLCMNEPNIDPVTLSPMNIACGPMPSRGQVN